MIEHAKSLHTAAPSTACGWGAALGWACFSAYQEKIGLGIVPVIPSQTNDNCGVRPVTFDREAYRDHNVIDPTPTEAVEANAGNAVQVVSRTALMR